MTPQGGRSRLIRELMRLMRPLQDQASIRWINRDLAVGCPTPVDGWRIVRARGVHAVVDLSEECGTLGDLVREHGMRYLRLSVDRAGLPDVEELHIVSSWVLERIREGGPVLLHDASVRGNDAVLACAVLIKEGAGVARAVSRLRGISQASLSESQMGLLHQFVAQLTLAAQRR